MHTIWETYEEPATSIYTDKSCKMGKEWEFNWNFIYQFFSHEYYSKFPFYEGLEKQVVYVYMNISHSHFHKNVTHLTMLVPCSKIVGIVVQ